MSWFSRIEEACAAFIERAFANMFPSDVEPAQIARKLVATMEARTQSGAGGVVPSQYTVHVHPADYARLDRHRTYLEHEWSALLTDVAARVGLQFRNGQPVVRLREESSVVAGGIEITVANEPPQRTLPAFSLRVVEGGPAGGVYRLRGAMRVGRDPQSDIPITDPSVSRSHALLDARREGLSVQDTGSTNGTYVNGKRVDSAVLQPGDVVSFGKTAMRVEAVSDPA